MLLPRYLPGCLAGASLLMVSTLGAEGTDVLDLDLESLGSVQVLHAVATPTAFRLVPAQMTLMDAEAIQLSGARNLNELVDIHVAQAQTILHHGHLEHVGFRGLISDREDKYLLRVNDRTMNQRFFVGAESERDLPLLGDLREVVVVEGPTAASYGAGALSGAVNLTTYDGLSFRGADLTVRQGLRDDFSAAEARWGQPWGERSGTFIYAGVADQDGADGEVAPYVMGYSFQPPNGGPPVVAGEEAPFPVVADHAMFEGRPKYKVHGSWVTGPFELWARVTQGGGYVRPLRSAVQRLGSEIALGRGNLDQQATVTADLKQPLTDELALRATVSVDRYRHLYTTTDVGGPFDRTEDELFSRLLLTWNPRDTQSFAVGLEHAAEWFDGPRINNRATQDTWDTQTLSALAEYQWQFSPPWTLFLSGRADHHTYTDTLLSPRLALSWAPTQADTLKFIAARSTRRSGDGELRQQAISNGSAADTESLDSLELRYLRREGAHLEWGSGVFLQRNDAIGYDAASHRSIEIGTFDSWGADIMVRWTDGVWHAEISHAYVKLLDADLTRPYVPRQEPTDPFVGILQAVTAMPYGYGDDFANWSNQVTKFHVTYAIDKQWTVSTSLRVYWGFPGAEDMAEWNGDEPDPARTTLSLVDPGYDRPFGPSAHLNLGLEYRPTASWTLRADAYNLLGLADEALNKRLYYWRGSEYTAEAVALAFSARYGF